MVSRAIMLPREQPRDLIHEQEEPGFDEPDGGEEVRVGTQEGGTHHCVRGSCAEDGFRPGIERRGNGGGLVGYVVEGVEFLLEVVQEPKREGIELRPWFEGIAVEEVAIAEEAVA